jgi:hypothetical protein
MLSHSFNFWQKNIIDLSIFRKYRRNNYFFTFAKTLSPLRLTIYYANKTFILHINNCSRGSFFIPFIGSSHLFDWDEINFAESAREMILTGNYATVQINYMPFWEKPPLFFWMQVLAMKAFNVLTLILDLLLNLVLASQMLSLVSLPFWFFIESDENSIMKSLVCCGLWDIWAHLRHIYILNQVLLTLLSTYLSFWAFGISLKVFLQIKIHLNARPTAYFRGYL